MLFDFLLFKQGNWLFNHVCFICSTLIPTFLDICKQCFFFFFFNIWSQLSLPIPQMSQESFPEDELFSALACRCWLCIDEMWRHASYWAISPDISTVSHNWAALCNVGHLRSLYSLECRVIQLKLVTSGRGCSHPLVGPKRAEGVSHEGRQLLVVPQTLTAGQDGAGVHLQQMGQNITRTRRSLFL